MLTNHRALMQVYHGSEVAVNACTACVVLLAILLAVLAELVILAVIPAPVLITSNVGFTEKH